MGPLAWVRDERRDSPSPQVELRESPGVQQLCETPALADSPPELRIVADGARIPGVQG